jgi:copper homeostasis protein
VGCLLEICVDTPAGLDAAVAGGADRIELCAALDLGGLTPAPGLIACARAQPVPVRAMIRPHAGGFVFGPPDRDAMFAEIDAIRAAGLAGIVVGAMTPGGRLDIDLLRLLVARGEGLGVTLHRCVDLLPDPVEAVSAARMLGIDTILTSGGRATAIEGAATIARMRAEAGGRVTILAGSGVTADNAGELLAGTGVDAVHASCRASLYPADPRSVALGFSPPAPRKTDEREVRRLRQAVDEYRSGTHAKCSG